MENWATRSKLILGYATIGLAERAPSPIGTNMMTMTKNMVMMTPTKTGDDDQTKTGDDDHDEDHAEIDYFDHDINNTSYALTLSREITNSLKAMWEWHSSKELLQCRNSL
ncbi:MAG: hypothetical protein CM1200mP24_03980 [Gammaproteobacteria bacterium]|nr:MAG: hypothetical protein CM1200mP24_03980 [Gammaproteobacteria bacterium]